MVLPEITRNPPPMPHIRPALLYVKDALLAVGRAGDAWNETQLREAIASARYYIDKIESALNERAMKTASSGPDPSYGQGRMR